VKPSSRSASETKGATAQPQTAQPEPAPPAAAQPEPAQPAAAQPLNSVQEVATTLKEQLAHDAQDVPKRKRGRPSKAQTEAEQRASADAGKAQRVGVLAVAFTSTIGGLVEHYEMSPPFTTQQGTALAEAWDPVILRYLSDSGPVGQAVMTTVVIMLPYLLQGAARARNRAVNRKAIHAQPQRDIGRPAGRGENAAGDKAG
jgi:hypothetical protein